MATSTTTSGRQREDGDTPPRCCEQPCRSPEMRASSALCRPVLLTTVPSRRVIERNGAFSETSAPLVGCGIGARRINQSRSQRVPAATQRTPRVQKSSMYSYARSGPVWSWPPSALASIGSTHAGTRDEAARPVMHSLRPESRSQRLDGRSPPRRCQYLRHSSGACRCVGTGPQANTVQEGHHCLKERQSRLRSA